MPAIKPQRLLDDLRALRRFGACGSGVVRPSLSAVDLDARRWLIARLRDAGLDAALDGLGSVIGRSPRPRPALLLGSHSDTQPRGGWLDGALGVIYALEVARALGEDPATAHLAIDVASWIDEEGTFSSCLGSRGFCGLLDAAALDNACSLDGRRLRDALADAGLDGVPARPPPGRYRGYLEAHIEQGPYLDDSGKRLGVVTAIVGSRTLKLTFHGQQNHAGTTPMPRRRDAGMALIEFAADVNRRFAELAGPASVWTVGRVVFDPGTSSIIPGRAEMLLQFRDPDETRLDVLQQALDDKIDALNRRGPVAIDAVYEPALPAAVMDPELAGALAAAAAARVPHGWQRMPSAALHDASYLATRMPAAMLFIPSIGGISHDFAEDTAEDDIVLGCQILADAAAAILTAP